MMPGKDLDARTSGLRPMFGSNVQLTGNPD